MRIQIYEALKKYPTTIEEDEILLQQSYELSKNQKNCIKLRYQDKRVLYGLLDVALAFDKVIKMSKKEAKEWLQDKHVGDYEYFEIKSADVYLKTVKDLLLEDEFEKVENEKIKDEL